jgi:hypothetical protein
MDHARPVSSLHPERGIARRRRRVYPLSYRKALFRAVFICAAMSLMDGSGFLRGHRSREVAGLGFGGAKKSPGVCPGSF